MLMSRSSKQSNAWKRVCQSTEVGLEVARGYIVEGRRLVVWRDAEDGVHVWDDSCPHRGSALSPGRVTGGLLTCPDHGWRFDTNGQLVRPLTSSKACVRAVHTRVYPVEEADGVVWVCLDQALPAGSGQQAGQCSSSSSLT